MAEKKDRAVGLTLENEPKKKLNGGHGEINISLHFQNGEAAPAPVERKMADVYTVGKELGRGGFSVVYEGTEKTTGKKVAIKYVNKTDKDADVIKLLLRYPNVRTVLLTCF